MAKAESSFPEPDDRDKIADLTTRLRLTEQKYQAAIVLADVRKGDRDQAKQEAADLQARYDALLEDVRAVVEAMSNIIDRWCPATSYGEGHLITEARDALDRPAIAKLMGVVQHTHPHKRGDVDSHINEHGNTDDHTHRHLNADDHSHERAHDHPADHTRVETE